MQIKSKYLAKERILSVNLENSWEKAEFFLKKDPVLKAWFQKVPFPTFLPENFLQKESKRPENLEIYFELLRTIIAQQLSTKSAQSILEKFKLENGGDLPMPERLLEMPEERLKKCGLSSQKISCLRTVSEKSLQNYFPTMAEALAMEAPLSQKLLTDLRGIGPWSADMVMLFALGHPDIFAGGDYGVREGYRLIYGEEKQFSPKILAEKTAIFSPYRSALTYYCWEVKSFVEKGQKISEDKR
ncbi:DNA-3-methyladenine glycosylase 2 family protein [Acetobacteraceae bacterium]|nr:DNA-3-methyladenine glycosylase 2 family protein [Acetobacteraceae bacterium]